MKQKIPASLQKIVNKMKKNKTNKTEEKVDAIEKEVLEATVETSDESVESAEEPRSKEEQLAIDLDEAKQKHLRLLAEFQNFRQRASKAQLEQASNATGKTILKILPVLDDFDRAAQQEEFSEGVNLVYQKLQATLEQIGVKPMESNGQPFNPDIHEAITEIPAPTPEQHGVIIDTIEKGYYNQDKILRFAKVIVGK